MIKRFMKFIEDRKKRHLHFFMLFLVLIFLPISVTVIFTYNNILNIIKSEKIALNSDRLNKSVANFDLLMSNEKNMIDTNLGDYGTIRASFQQSKNLSTESIERVSKYMVTKYDSLVESTQFIKAVAGRTQHGIIFNGTEQINNHELTILDEKLNNEGFIYPRDSTWIYNKEGIYYQNKENIGNLIYVYNVLQSLDENNEEINHPKDGELVGRMYVFFDIYRVIELLQATITDEENKIYIYDENNNPIIVESEVNYSDIINELRLLKGNDKSLIKKIDQEELLIQLSSLNSTKWYIINELPVSSMTSSVKKSLYGYIGVLIFISVLVAIWILADIQVLANIKSEKDIIRYKLAVTEEMNEKLRIYKHDFQNHLQIIWGLITSGKYDNAVDYVKNVTNQGENATRKYSVGVPEIDSIISSTIYQAKKLDIEVEIDLMEIPTYFKVELFDLCKILTNLIKNALHQLKKQKGYKLLSIYISYELDEYIFEISNNKPLIDKKIRDKIFNKGFTTKINRSGGLGLHIVKSLVEKNNGIITLNVDEYGNHFCVRVR